MVSPLSCTVFSRSLLSEQLRWGLGVLTLWFHLLPFTVYGRLWHDPLLSPGVSL